MARKYLNTNKMSEQLKEPKPKSLKDVPKYIKTVTANFCTRLFYILKLVWEAKPLILVAMILFAVFNGFFPVLNAFVTASLLNRLAQAFTNAVSGSQADFSKIIVVLIFQFALLFLKTIVSNLETIVTRISGELVTNHIKLKIMNKSRKVDISSFDNPDFYAKLENANREAGIRPITILSATLTIISTIISLISFIAVLYGVSPFAPFILLVFAIPGIVINFIYKNKYYKYILKTSRDRRQLNYYSNIIVNKDIAKEVRLFDLSDSLIVKYKNVYGKYYTGMRNLFIREGIWNIFISFCSTAVSAGLFAFVAWGVYKGEFQIGDYSLYTGALNALTSGAATSISCIATIYEGTLFIDNLINFLKEKANIKPLNGDGIAVNRHTPHKIKFDNVSFSYPGSDKYVIKNMSFEINDKDTVVIVGLNGAGKTTLIKLLTRLYDPSDGTIYLDGKDIREYNVKELYDIFGIIFQDFGKYAFSVKENIAFGDIKNEIDMDNIHDSAKKSSASDFIKDFPKKYDTQLMKYFDDDGIEPSIGQWQKISIARAFYGDSDIMILDEPTASLDPIAEHEIFSRFDELSKNKTTIFVSHRLSSAVIASKIFVIENGELIETGNHKELMNKKGKYYELFTTQAQRYMNEQ